MEDREIRQDRYMSDSEALMWAVEKDPWLSSAMGSLLILDVPVDFDRLLIQMHEASTTLLRLRERVVEGRGAIPPRFVLDHEFSIENHISKVKLDDGSGLESIHEMAARIYAEPFDASKPLWQFVAVEAADDHGDEQAVGGALLLKLHHSLTDGIGALRLAEMYFDIERAPEHRLEQAKGGLVASIDRSKDLQVQDGSTKQSLKDDLTYIAQRQFSFGRVVLSELVLWPADKVRITDTIDKSSKMLQSGLDVIGVGDPEARTPGSPLWRRRSSGREYRTLKVSLDGLKAAAEVLDGTVNDVFVTASAIAVSRYHTERDVTPERFNLGFVMSTRSDDSAAGNSFTPFPFTVSGGEKSTAEWFIEVRDAMARKRQSGSLAGEVMDSLAGGLRLLPDELVSRFTRSRVTNMDWATSNLRGAPFPLFVAGAEVLGLFPVGPVAGTAFNLSVVSYCGVMHLGLHSDPVAVKDPDRLIELLEQVLDEMVSPPPVPA